LETIKDGSGNGSSKGKMADGIAAAFAGRKEADGTMQVTDLVEASLLSMFYLQKLGKASVSEILEKMTSIKLVIDLHLAEQAMDALQARGFVSYARGRSAGSGDSVKMWKPKRSLWAAPPEVAQLAGADLLSFLVGTEEAKGLIAQLNDAEAEGDGEEKAKSKIQYAEYESVRIRAITTDDWFGSQPKSPLLDSRVKGAGEADLRFYRGNDGTIVICSDVVAGWLRTNMRQQDLSDAVAGYVACSEIRLPGVKLGPQAAFPVIDQRTKQGKGLTTYETLPAGTVFEVTFSVPTRGFLEVDEFVRHVAAIGLSPIRGLSPARGKKCGKFAVVSYEKLGSVKKDSATALRTAVGLLPEGKEFDEARKFYAEQIERATKKNA
jgi:hypothetical protein